MGTSLAEQLERDMACEGLLECIHDLGALDRECFRTLVDGDDRMTIDEIADRVNRERSTTYRSLQRLREAGFVEKEQVNYEHGGYHHVYSPRDPARIATDMQRTLNDWYAKMGQLIQEFEDKYTHATGEAALER